MSKIDQLIEGIAKETHKAVQRHPDSVVIKFGMMPASIANELDKQLEAVFTKEQAGRISNKIHARVLQLANCPF